MGSLRLIPAAVFMVFALGLLCDPMWAQPPESYAEQLRENEGADEPSSTKARVLAWLDKFAAEQVLFNPKDVANLREKVERMSDSEAAAWWQKTRVERDMLESKEWKETREWLKQFLSVQAIYSQEDINHFRSEAAAAAKTSPEDLKTVLDKIMARRRSFIQAGRTSEEMRQQRLAYSQHFRQEQSAARNAARRAAYQPPGASVVPPTENIHDRFRNAGPPPPLVDSLDAARWSVMGSFWRNTP